MPNLRKLELPEAIGVARGTGAQALLDRGYGKSVAVSMDVVDEGQAHLKALQALADRRQRINREKTLGEGA